MGLIRRGTYGWDVMLHFKTGELKKGLAPFESPEAQW